MKTIRIIYIYRFTTCLYIFIYVYVYIYIYIYTYAYVFNHPSIHISIHACINSFFGDQSNGPSMRKPIKSSLRIHGAQTMATPPGL